MYKLYMIKRYIRPIYYFTKRLIMPKQDRSKISRLIKELRKNRYRFKGKGIEIGGPSACFASRERIKIYGFADGVDGMNWSLNNTWVSNEGSDGRYYYGNKVLGDLYIGDATKMFGCNEELTNVEYDFLLSSNCLEHIANPILAIEKWLSVLKMGGSLLLVVPRKESNFDHNRMITTVDHLLSDYMSGVGEDDLTHLEEIMSFHDLSMDQAAGTRDEFVKRSRDNINNRCLHHHIFDERILFQLAEHFNMKIIFILDDINNYWMLAEKE